MLYLVPFFNGGVPGRNIRFITTDPDYEDAKEIYIEKRAKRMSETTDKTIKDVEKIDGRAANHLKKKTMKALTD
jgi:hypothetical protein